MPLSKMCAVYDVGHHIIFYQIAWLCNILGIRLPSVGFCLDADACQGRMGILVYN
jgi:hypothetical protein